jgi:uncharacterized repeat protein (TIGR03803 family)
LQAGKKTVLYRFSVSDGAYPSGDLVFDSDGNIYGTTMAGGSSGAGTVYELAHSAGGWTESVLYSFTGGSDGGAPVSGVVFDDAGNLYGTAYVGGDLSCLPSQGCGTVFQIAPSPTGWTQNVLHTFHGGSDGGRPGGLVFDNLGNLYGGTPGHEPGADGTVFMLSQSGGHWTYAVLHNFGDGYAPGPGRLTLDAGRNLYGVRGSNSHPYGTVFRLTADGSGWRYTPLHDFTGGLDGGGPSGVTLDSHGNIYGTADEGGDPQWCRGYGGCGVVWEITP